MATITITPIVEPKSIDYPNQREADLAFFRLVVGTTAEFRQDGIARVITDVNNGFSQTIDTLFAQQHPEFDQDFKKRLIFMKRDQLIAAYDQYYES